MVSCSVTSLIVLQNASQALSSKAAVAIRVLVTVLNGFPRRHEPSVVKGACPWVLATSRVGLGPTNRFDPHKLEPGIVVEADVAKVCAVFLHSKLY